MVRHTLKIWPEYFQKVIDGKKKAELRLNDRNFQIGDEMLLQEYDPEYKDYTGREVLVKITDMTEGTGHLISGHVMLSFERIEDQKEAELSDKLKNLSHYISQCFIKTNNDLDHISTEEFQKHVANKVIKISKQKLQQIMQYLKVQNKMIDKGEYFEQCFIGIKIVK